MCEIFDSLCYPTIFLEGFNDCCNCLDRFTFINILIRCLILKYPDLLKSILDNRLNNTFVAVPEGHLCVLGTHVIIFMVTSIIIDRISSVIPKTHPEGSKDALKKTISLFNIWSYNFFFSSHLSSLRFLPLHLPHLPTYIFQLQICLNALSLRHHPLNRLPSSLSTRKKMTLLFQYISKI